MKRAGTRNIFVFFYLALVLEKAFLKTIKKAFVETIKKEIEINEEIIVQKFDHEWEGMLT